jgi:ribonuclease P protein component
MPNNNGKARLGVIASKRCMSKAVTRNKCKRMVREIFRLHPLKDTSVDVVVQVRNFSTLSAVAQRIELIRLFSQLEVLCKRSLLS